MDFQSEKSFGKLRLRAFQPYHQILCVSKHVEDVEDRSNTPKGCNAMYVEDVEDIKTSHNRCILKYVEDVEDRSNTHKGCNAMYVEDVEDIKTSHNRCILKYVEDVEDDQIHLRAVMLCMFFLSGKIFFLFPSVTDVCRRLQR